MMHGRKMLRNLLAFRTNARWTQRDVVAVADGQIGNGFLHREAEIGGAQIPCLPVRRTTLRPAAGSFGSFRMSGPPP